jgi:acyl-CoA synthetase (AMP-forming)/AMP-acid ligase II
MARSMDRLNIRRRQEVICIMTEDSSLLSIHDIIFYGNQDPDHHAVESPGLLPLTYRDLREQVLSVVKTLNTNALHRNDRIAVIAPAGPETAVIIVSVMAGFTCIPLNPHNTIPEYERIFSQLKIQAIIVPHDCETVARVVAGARNIPVIDLIPFFGIAGKFELKLVPSQDTKEAEEAEFATSSDISHILLTSGITSRQKIVPISQRQSSLLRQRQTKPLLITKNDRCLHIVPYYHGMGIGLPLLDILFAGGTIICIKNFISSDFVPLLVTYRPTLYIAGPAHHQGILREIKKVPPDTFKNNSLRLILSSSALLPEKVYHGLETLLGVPVVEQYALSETGIISLNFPPKRGSVGLPVVEYLQILNENDAIVGSYENGEIVVKGETVFNGYEDAPNENKAAFINGWFRTGDLGYRDKEGYLFITGRKKELINKGGVKISPSEIDAVLTAHPGVSEAMAFPVPDPFLGEDIAVMIVRKQDNLSENDLRKFLLDHLMPSKLPRRIYFVDAIPKNPAGKPLRYIGTQRYS